MTCNKLLKILACGEDSLHQFKERFKSIDQLAVEINAFANSEGGELIVGASDKGIITGLSRDEIGHLNQWISNATILSFLEKDATFRYSGRGSGIPRMLRKCREAEVPLELVNDREKQQFKVVFYRKAIIPATGL